MPGVPTELPTVVPGAKYGEDESFFDDALFIGDSRMVSSAYYARLGKADYFTDVGMNVFQMFSVTASDNNFDTTDLTTLLQNRTYKKIFIMLGINECGYPMSSLLSAYQEDIDTLKSLQPDATIYLLKVYGVSRSVAEGTSYFSPQRLQEVNDGIAVWPTARRFTVWMLPTSTAMTRLHEGGVHQRRRPSLRQGCSAVCPVAVPADQRRSVGLYRSPDVWYPV